MMIMVNMWSVEVYIFNESNMYIGGNEICVRTIYIPVVVDLRPVGHIP